MLKFVVNQQNLKYNKNILFSKEIFAKGGTNMNNADLVWHLVELLLQKEKDSNQVALDQAKNDNKPNDQRPNEVQLTEIMIMQHYHFATLSFFINLFFSYFHEYSLIIVTQN